MRKSILLILSLLLVSCGSDSSGPSDPGTPTSISGTVVKDRVLSSSVTLHSIAADGGPGALVAGPFTTDANGNWAGELPAGSSGPFYLLATGGSYVDEASGATVDIAAGTMLGYTSDGSGIVSPFTQMLFDVVAEADASLSVTEAWQGAIAVFTSQFGFDPTTVVPGTSGVAPGSYTAALGGLSLLIEETPALSGLGASIFEIVMGLVADTPDGVLDGIDFAGNPISVGSSRVDLPPVDLTGLGLLVDCFNDYADSIAELAALNFGTIVLDFGDIIDPVEVSGSLALSGPGTSVLPQSTFNVTSGYVSESFWIWSGPTVGLGAMSMNVSRVDIGTDVLWVAAFAYSGGSEESSHGWGSSTYESAGSISLEGDTFTFDDLTLPYEGQPGGEVGDLTLNGTLEALQTPGGYRLVVK